MRKLLLIFILSAGFATASMAQDSTSVTTSSTDSTTTTAAPVAEPTPAAASTVTAPTEPAPSTEPTAKESKWNYEFTIGARNLWRGLDLGGQPSVQGTVELKAADFLTIGTKIAMGINEPSYGNNARTYINLNAGKFYAMFTDYYYFNQQADFFNYGNNTTHMIEGALKYDDKKAYLMAAMSLYGADADTTSGLYLETGYKLSSNISAVIGYVTDASAINFSSKAGFTNIGLAFSNEIVLAGLKTTAKTSLVVNPNYKNMMDLSNGSTNNQITANLSLTF
jgi:hypothetical protein